MPKPFRVEHANPIAFIVVVAGAALTVVGLVDLNDDLLGIDGWVYWLLGAGIIAFLIGLYMVISYLRLVSDFDDLMKVESKAEFVRRLDDVEYIAWRLPSKYEARLSVKKKELGIK